MVSGDTLLIRFVRPSLPRRRRSFSSYTLEIAGRVATVSRLFANINARENARKEYQRGIRLP